ncbi:hypothetical protein C5E45_07320 [Nocardia nova]|uniref:Uncharacterized protein n=1 Tax=Nocardia nova TaxID=37330 RepID=A0A2S6AU14_9NOCA|nr:hypothetical protein C5E41_09020 [Nocardia nova]PPJ38700.1 hypothetical protein C5E45_07320 [Nocardia nova]
MIIPDESRHTVVADSCRCGDLVVAGSFDTFIVVCVTVAGHYRKPSPEEPNRITVRDVRPGTGLAFR